MTPRRALIVVALTGVATFALSFVNAWIVHAREVRGEGYRYAEITLGAWRDAGMPVLTAGALAALAVGLVAGWSVRTRRRVPPAVVVLGSALALGLIGSAALPVAHDGHASSVDLSAGPLLAVGVLLVAGQLAAAVVAAGVPRRVLVTAGVLALVAVGGGWAGRWWGLQLAEGTGRHWSDGSYTRTATGDQPTETLTIGDGSVTVAERWSGTWEWSGWTVVISDDPACPDARGTYHAHGEGEQDLRFVKVVDPCADGERAADLESGIWVRDP